MSYRFASVVLLGTIALTATIGDGRAAEAPGQIVDAQIARATKAVERAQAKLLAANACKQDPKPCLQANADRTAKRAATAQARAKDAAEALASK